METSQKREISSPRIDRLRDFVISFSALIDKASGEPEILREGSTLLKKLISVDDWLPDQYAQASSSGYQQYLLHLDSHERFSVVSFVWGPSQKSPIHDHTVWGIVGILRGAEYEQSYSRTSDGRFVEEGEPERLAHGEVAVVSPTVGDFHQVSNAIADQSSISIHVYGANIGSVQRSMYEKDGTRKEFRSGYTTWRCRICGMGRKTDRANEIARKSILGFFIQA
jgi:predicted metal-dependent enzyme (double-stranded beta helix superfamily)